MPTTIWLCRYEKGHPVILGNLDEVAGATPPATSPSCRSIIPDPEHTMSFPQTGLVERLLHLRHPGGLSLGDATKRLGVPEGRVAEALAEHGQTLPGGSVRTTRLAADPETLLTALLSGGPIAIGVGDHGIGGWRLATMVSVVYDRPALRIRWDGAELVLPSDGLRAYGLVEATGCRCGERRSVVWYDATGRPLMRATQRVEADQAAFAGCCARFAEPLPATWAEVEPVSRQTLEADRRQLPPEMLGRIAADLHLALDAPPLTLVLGQGHYLLVQHALSWQNRSADRTCRFSDGPGWVNIWQDAITGVAIVRVPSPGSLHAIEVNDASGQRGLAILPQQAPDGSDPAGWADLIAAWSEYAT